MRLSLAWPKTRQLVKMQQKPRHYTWKWGESQLTWGYSQQQCKYYSPLSCGHHLPIMGWSTLKNGDYLMILPMLVGEILILSGWNETITIIIIGWLVISESTIFPLYSDYSIKMLNYMTIIISGWKSIFWSNPSRAFPLSIAQPGGSGFLLPHGASIAIVI